MKKPAGVETNHVRVVDVLSVGPDEQDHMMLDNICKGSQWTLCPDSQWRVRACPTLLSAWDTLRKGEIPIVLCESEMEPGTWNDLLQELRHMPDPPFLIVTSRHADERLWAEALNLGAYDVLAKPYDGAEVVRTLSLAWLRWREAHEYPPLKMASGM